jgi:hypothetical protein
MPKSKGKEKTELNPTFINNTSKRACLGGLPGSFKLPSDLVKKLKIPHFVSELEARSWKCEEKLVGKYFERTARAGDTPEQVLSVLIRVMKSISKAPQIRPNLSGYCAAVASQLTTEDSKKRFKKHYKKQKNEMEIKENEEEASMEAKIVSRILTTLETKNHKVELRKKLDDIFQEESNDDEEVMFNRKKDTCCDILST